MESILPKLQLLQEAIAEDKAGNFPLECAKIMLERV